MHMHSLISVRIYTICQQSFKYNSQLIDRNNNKFTQFQHCVYKQYTLHYHKIPQERDLQQSLLTEHKQNTIVSRTDGINYIIEW